MFTPESGVWSGEPGNVPRSWLLTPDSSRFAAYTDSTLHTDPANQADSPARTLHVWSSTDPTSAPAPAHTDRRGLRPESYSRLDMTRCYRPPWSRSPLRGESGRQTASETGAHTAVSHRRPSGRRTRP